MGQVEGPLHLESKLEACLCPWTLHTQTMLAQAQTPPHPLDLVPSVVLVLPWYYIKWVGVNALYQNCI